MISFDEVAPSEVCDKLMKAQPICDEGDEAVPSSVVEMTGRSWEDV